MHTILRIVIRLAQGVAALVVVLLVVSGFMIWDLHRTEGAVSLLHRQLQEGVALAQVTAPTLGLLSLTLATAKEADDCLRISHWPNGATAKWRTRQGKSWQEESLPLARGQIFAKLAAHHAAQPQCTHLQVSVHQEYGYMTGSFDLVLDAQGKASQLSPLQFLD